MEFVTVGHGEINESTIRPIEDAVVTRKQTGFYKPNGGGMWLGKFYPKYPEYNDWVDYLIDHPGTLYWKRLGKDMWNIPCSRVTLRDDAKIYQLDSLEAFLTLVRNYPFDGKMFSYEKLSKDYDGIFIRVYRISRCNNEVLNALVKQCSFDSLLLFNVDAIESYFPGMVHIEEFDLEFAYDKGEMPTYTIEYETGKKRIRK